jgi:hypothetical protein
VTDFLHDSVARLDSVVVAEFGLDRGLLRQNAGFARLAAQSRTDAWSLIIQPRLDAFLSPANTPRDNAEIIVHQGLITLGDADGETHTLSGTIRRSATGLTLVAGI